MRKKAEKMRSNVAHPIGLKYSGYNPQPPLQKCNFLSTSPIYLYLNIKPVEINFLPGSQCKITTENSLPRDQGWVKDSGRVTGCGI